MSSLPEPPRQLVGLQSRDQFMGGVEESIGGISARIAAGDRSACVDLGLLIGLQITSGEKRERRLSAAGASHGCK